MTEAQPASLPGPQPGPLSVLVVDDDFRVAGLHAELVDAQPAFRTVGTAHTADAARKLAQERPVDLALVDIYLPDDSGLELLRQLRCDTFAVTAATEGAAVRSALSAGALACLLKPFPPELLAGKLRGYARFRQLTAAETADQELVEEALGALRGTPNAAGPRAAAQTATRDLVLDAVRQAPAPLSAGEAAGLIGVSRATAQRYLAGLVRRGQLRMKLRYGATGRPEQEYRTP